MFSYGINHGLIEGVCGAIFRNATKLNWLTNDASYCVDGRPCQHEIIAPEKHVVILNFTRLSGLEYSEIKSDSSTYDLIDGQSNCQPRIEVSGSVF